ncbi:MAG: hypothetical protein OXC19_07900 [Bryobacterales bacterium]|nr:hypothetical protein [Bryobacterales bacterium]
MNCQTSLGRALNAHQYKVVTANPSTRMNNSFILKPRCKQQAHGHFGTVAVALQAGYRSVKSLRSTVTDHDLHRYWCRVAAWLVDSVTAIPND